MASKRGLDRPRRRQFSGEARYSAGAEGLLAAGLRRLRPPREPRRVFFFALGCSAPSWPFSACSGTAASSAGSPTPSSRSGRWILGAGSAFASALCSLGISPFVAAAAVAEPAGLRLRFPPLDPRRVFFFGV